MAYTAWSVVFGEQPSAAKWNQLGANDAGFKTGENIDDGALGTYPNIINADASDVGFYEIGRTTLGSAGDTISVTSIPARQYLKVLIYTLATGGTANHSFDFNADTASNYARRASENGGAEVTTNASGTPLLTTAQAGWAWIEVSILNIEAQEKILYATASLLESAGTGAAADVPDRYEFAGKWANTAAQITRIDVKNSGGTGDYAIGSEVVVLGKD